MMWVGRPLVGPSAPHSLVVSHKEQAKEREEVPWPPLLILLVCECLSLAAVAGRGHRSSWRCQFLSKSDGREYPQSLEAKH